MDRKRKSRESMLSAHFEDETKKFVYSLRTYKLTSTEEINILEILSVQTDSEVV